MEEIEYLYHYTSLERLAQILKNRTIRLSPLDKMDDLQEQKTADMRGLGRYVFISSWTSEEKESIPMWSMYTKMDSGIRIGLRKNPFVRHSTKGTDFLIIPGMKPKNKESEEHVEDTFLNIAQMMMQGVFSPQAWKGDILREVEYTDDITRLEPKIISSDDTYTHFNFGKLGYVKNTYWAFQKEWRYVMQFYRYPWHVEAEKQVELFMKDIARMIQGMDTPPFDHFDLHIDDTAYSDMIITPSPKMSQGNRILLEALIKEYNPSARLEESKLLGLI